MNCQRYFVFALTLVASLCVPALAHPQGITGQQQLEGPTTTGFGRAIDVEGSVAVVGVTGANHQFYSDPGYVNVYRKTGSGWSFAQKLTPADSRRSDEFGQDVAISGNTIVVGGAFAAGPSSAPFGAVYIFGFNGTTWVEQAKLTASDAKQGNLFGQDVDIDGDTVVVGALGADNTGGISGGGLSGAAYVYERIAGTWRETKLPSPPDRKQYGASVAVSGNTICVGMWVTGSSTRVGAAFVYERIATWSEQARLEAPDGVPHDDFGSTCATDGDSVVVGAQAASAPAKNQGAAYVFARAGGGWPLEQKLTSTGGGASDYLSRGLQVMGDMIVLGAPNYNTAGAAYVYTRSGVTWTQVHRLQPNTGIGSDGFGMRIALDSQSLFIGVGVLREINIYGHSGGGATGSPPGQARNFAASVIGSVVRTTWDHPTSGGAPTGYVLRARTTGGALIATLPMALTTAFNTAAPNGVFVLTVQATNAAGSGQESVSATVTVPSGGSAPPGPPTSLSASISGNSATFSWAPPASGGAATGYLLVAGSTPGFAIPMASLPLPGTPGTTVPGIPAGTYHVRVLAGNAAGMGGASNEVQVVVGAVSAPGAPVLNPAAVSGRTVSLSWSPGSGATSYILTASGTPGGASMVSVPLAGTSAAFADVPSGTYYLRVLSVSGGGQTPSNEVVVVVP